ncbi:hypothetical protein OU994_19750 [Pseudoduganella sp. SL102]|uniref:hypothetical protein n=1 Tax=Pseudoduganella sp. SL102 TaxID=2995154 RepID=UPI00248BF226|nr:hypothetical protein [Pseudoduganella sp. SL102]WBS00543.1 hypothetical protein OU994_19750 [Pseudoduganella sp. SL102]
MRDAATTCQAYVPGDAIRHSNLYPFEHMKLSTSVSAAGAVIILALCNTSAGATGNKATLDLTPVFAGMEKDCAGSNPKFDAVLRWLTTHSGKAPATAKAGAEMRAAIGAGRIQVKDDGDSWTLTAPVTGASYRGAAVTGIERWVGKDNGINGISLTFAGSLAAVSKSLGNMKPATGNEDPSRPQLLVEDGTARAVLMCDFSN